MRILEILRLLAIHSHFWLYNSKLSKISYRSFAKLAIKNRQKHRFFRKIILRLQGSKPYREYLEKGHNMPLIISWEETEIEKEP